MGTEQPCVRLTHQVSCQEVPHCCLPAPWRQISHLPPQPLVRLLPRLSLGILGWGRGGQLCSYRSAIVGSWSRSQRDGDIGTASDILRRLLFAALLFPTIASSRLLSCTGQMKISTWQFCFSSLPLYFQPYELVGEEIRAVSETRMGVKECAKSGLSSG